MKLADLLANEWENFQKEIDESDFLLDQESWHAFLSIWHYQFGIPKRVAAVMVDNCPWIWGLA